MLKIREYHKLKKDQLGFKQNLQGHVLRSKNIKEGEEKKNKMELTSPIPITARATSKKGSPNFAATGVKAVAKDHQTTPNPKTRFPPTVSAHIPPAI